jgi:membrane protein EpsK
MFGSEMTGLYGAILVFPLLIDTMVETILSVLSPAIIAQYAVGDIDGMRRTASSSVKISGIGLALPVGLLCGFGGPLLNLWLGPAFARMDLLLVLLVGHFTVNAAIRPLCYVLNAYNRVKVQGLVTLALGVVNVVLAIAVAQWTGWGAAGVAAACAVVWTARNAVFLSSYIPVVMRLHWWTFYAPLALAALSTLGVAVAGRLVLQLWWPTTWLALGMLATATSVLYGVFAYTVCLSHSDRRLLLSLLRRRDDQSPL